RMAPDIVKQADIFVLHIAEVTGKAIKKQGMKKIALLGTRYVMEGDFYTQILQEKFGLDVMIPDENERTFIHNTIFEELIKGVVSEASRAKFVAIINHLASQGAEGIILGCTEIPLLIEQKHVSVPLFNTTNLHASAAVDLALNESEN
ncbi:MAG: amino acid racemase, partial [Eubacteriales bacterium]